MSQRWVIRNARIIDPVTRREETRDVCIENGMIVPCAGRARGQIREIDAGGLAAVPGLVDLHVHFREPGDEEAETVASGSMAAAKGGFTCVVTMPNTSPPVDSPETVERALSCAAASGRVRVLPSGCITKGRRGTEVCELRGMAAAGAVAFTDDGSTVPDASVMRQAMGLAKGIGRPVMDHALDSRAAGQGVMHACEEADRLGLPGIASSAESQIVARDIRLCEQTGCRVHIQHVSCAESVELIRAARARGLPVSGEATPHHLALTVRDVSGRDADFKMNPPLRMETDRQSLLAAVADGTLQALATDHAPHRQADKAKGFAEAPFGVIGLETAVGVSYSLLVKGGLMSELDWVSRWTVGPAAVLGLAPPSLEPGSPADITLLDLETEWVVDPRSFVSKARNTPFGGRRLTGQAVRTLCRGATVWNARASQFASTPQRD